MIEMQVESQAIHSRWGLAIGEDQQSPMIVRYLQELPPVAARRKFGDLVTVQWNYETQMANGMPTREQSHQMDIFEGALLRTLEHTGKGILTAVYTQDGVREWQIYVSDPAKAEKAINKLSSGEDQKSITVAMQRDPHWKNIGEIAGI
jgi:hypothetical protein